MLFKHILKGFSAAYMLACFQEFDFSKFLKDLLFPFSAFFYFFFEKIVLGMIHDVHENRLIFKTPHRPCSTTSKILPTPWLWTSNFRRTPPLSLFLSLSLSLQMITNQLKEKIIQGWLLHVIRTFLQVGFRFQYQPINLVWLSFDFFSFSWSLTIISPSSWLYTLACAVVQKYQEMSFIYNYSHF